MNRKLKQIYLTIGPSSSGKTFFINQRRNSTCCIISADDIKKELYGGEWLWYANHGTFQELIRRFKRVLPKIADWSHTIYLDYPFLSLLSREQVYKAIKQSGIECTTHALLFKTPLCVCLERNRHRAIKLPEKIIRRQFERTCYPQEFSQLNVDIIGRDAKDYPDVPYPNWHLEVNCHKFNNCCKAIQSLEGGDDHALLVNGDDSTESHIHNGPLSGNSDCSVRDIPLHNDVHTEEGIDPLLEHVLRNRSRLWVRSRRGILDWLKG